jgi:hypothetical protein
MSLLGLLPGATDHLPVLATVKDAARRYAAALRTVLDRACAPARLAATGGTEHTGHTRREIKPILAETESLQNPGRSTFQGGHQRLINRGPKSIGPGDLFLSTGMPVLDTATGHRIGTSDATELIVSTRHDGTVLGQSTLRLRGGHVELDGVVRHTDSPFRVSITGGTGRYLGVGGQLTMLREDDVHKAVVMKLELIH